MAHDVFISHSPKDKAAGDLIYATLEANGIRCWIASRDILPGSDRETSIAKAISDSKLLVVVSPSNGSASVADEIGLAVTAGLPIIPVQGGIIKELGSGKPNTQLATLLKNVSILLGKEGEVPAERTAGPSVLRLIPAAPITALQWVGRIPRGKITRRAVIIAATCVIVCLFVAWQLAMDSLDRARQRASNYPSGVIDHPSPDAPAGTITRPRAAGNPHVCVRNYPVESARLGEQGATTLGFTIKRDGTTDDIHVETSSGFPRLDAAAILCASSWLYRPATRDGDPIDVRWKAEVRWVLH